MSLPGTIHERIGDLRSRYRISQKKLAETIGIAASQLSRIENGETQSVSSDILIKLSKAFGVSTDYILGLTTISAPKSRDISELGLSEGAVKCLINGSVDVEMLNRLMEHKTFPYLLYLIKTYFDNSITRPNDDGYMFQDVWLFQQEVDISQTILQTGEVCDVMWANEKQIT